MLLWHCGFLGEQSISDCSNCWINKPNTALLLKVLQIPATLYFKLKKIKNKLQHFLSIANTCNIVLKSELSVAMRNIRLFLL